MNAGRAEVAASLMHCGEIQTLVLGGLTMDMSIRF
jgi:hypothetical protein